MLSGLKWVNLNLDTKRVTIWRGKRCYFLEMRLTLASCLDRWDEPLGLANVCGRRATDFVALQCFNDASGTLKTGLWLRVNMLRRSINVLRLHYCFRCSAVSDCNSLITQTHVGAAGRAQEMREKRRLAKPYPGQSFALWSRSLSQNDRATSPCSIVVKPWQLSETLCWTLNHFLPWENQRWDWKTISTEKHKSILALVSRTGPNRAN